MKYRLDRTDFEVYKNDIYLLPTIGIIVNNKIYTKENFSIEFHFLVFHGRMLFMKNR